jgi:hypothetical protein
MASRRCVKGELPNKTAQFKKGKSYHPWGNPKVLHERTSVLDLALNTSRLSKPISNAALPSTTAYNPVEASIRNCASAIDGSVLISWTSCIAGTFARGVSFSFSV